VWQRYEIPAVPALDCVTEQAHRNGARATVKTHGISIYRANVSYAETPSFEGAFRWEPLAAQARLIMRVSLLAAVCEIALIADLIAHFVARRACASDATESSAALVA
jgi:hypothetical protein